MRDQRPTVDPTFSSDGIPSGWLVGAGHAGLAYLSGRAIQLTIGIAGSTQPIPATT
jgi:hypothetical protein